MIFPLTIIAGSSALLISTLYSFLLFHILVEVFTVVIALGMFAIAWSSRRYISNIFLLLIGISYFFVGSLDVIYTLTYKGINIIPEIDNNVPAQLWIAARYLEAFSFFAAFLFSREENPKNFTLARKKSHLIFSIYAIVVGSILILIFPADLFPDAYGEGSVLTNFKVYSEYAVAFLLILSLGLLFRKRAEFDRKMANLLSLALVLKIFSETAFAGYSEMHNFSNVLGHLFRFVSAALLYKAVLEGGLMRPYQILFSDLQKSETRYRSLVELSPDPIVVHSQGTIVYANDPAKRLFGVAGEKEIIGAELADFFHPDYREQMRTRIKKVSSGELKRTPMMEMEVLRPDGRIVPVEIKGMKITFAGRSAVESIIRDISGRKAAEEKIRSLAKFPEENPNPVIRVLAGGEVQYANQPAREMLASLGWKEGMLFPEVLSGDVREVLEKATKHETEIACPSGKIFFITLSPSSTEGWVNIYGRDVTEHRRAEEKLLQAQAELRKRVEEQLLESHKYLGLVNRKISLLLEIEKHSQSRENKQEIMDYLISSALSLSNAKLALLYVASGKSHFNMVSRSGLEKDSFKHLQMVSGSDAGFIDQLVQEKQRINGPCGLVDVGCFNHGLELSYFVALPILSGDAVKGFIFLGFTDRKSMDPQDLQFLDVFSRHVSAALQNARILG